ncbi:MAG TPA: multiheme c-type cytochrome [Puia sp.]|nr:multiheme c-type cytochrome [Puia sp.]
MKRFTRYRHSLAAVSMIFLCIFFWSRCIDKNKDEADESASATEKPGAARPAAEPPAVYVDKVSRDQFAGSQACARCHKQICDSHVHTAHYLTTRLASEGAIKGSFHAGKNRFAYGDGMVVAMEKRDSGLFQVGYLQGVEKIARRFDIVVGSGAKGQTYLSREGNSFYQLPVSYFTAAKEWANSPLFPTHPVLFNRPITSRCLECHSTYAKKISSPNRDPEEFDRSQTIYGVDCEKCHGPAARHVAFQTANPSVRTAGYIVNPAKLTRQQNLDLCALCHGGRLQKTTASFAFQAGDTLSHFFRLAAQTAPPDPKDIDVHGNQYGLMRASQCFIKSNTLTCNTCHDSHANERGKIAVFSQRCMTCHNDQQGSFCKLKDRSHAVLAANCIDCHMPKQASRSITELLPGDKTPTAALIRSHFISIYPETKKIPTIVKQ